MIDDEACPECDGDGLLELRGEPSHLIDDPYPGDVFDLARLIYYARERAWTPVEYSQQSAVFIQAYEVFRPVVFRYLAEENEKARKESELKWRPATPSK